MLHALDYESDYDDHLVRSNDFLVNGEVSLFNRVAPPPNIRNTHLIKPPLTPRVNGGLVIPGGRKKRDFNTIRIDLHNQRKGEKQCIMPYPRYPK